METLKVIVEMLGTFFFLSVILQTLTNREIGPTAVAVTLLAVIYFGASTSGAHFNPAVSFAMFMKNKMDMQLLVTYVLAQLIGATLAVKFNNVLFAPKLM
jgi:aquaporin Z